MIWLNGALCPAGIACIDPADRGLLLGDGLFETIAVRGGAACDVGRHFTRLADCAAVLRITVPFDAAVLAQAFGAGFSGHPPRDWGV
jgi:branched-chain amino acid aminotransferase